MSGPKYSHWSVIENARLARAQRREALAELARLEAQRQAALSEIQRLDSSLSTTISELGQGRSDIAAQLEAGGRRLRHPGADASLDEIRHFASQLQGIVAEAQASLERAAAFRRIEREFSTVAEAAHRESAEHNVRRVAQDEIEKQKRRETATRVVARAPGDLDEVERASLTKLAMALVDAPPARFRSIEGELRAEVQRLQKRAAQRQKDSAEAASLRRQLWGFAGHEVNAFSSKLAMIEAGKASLDPSLRSSISTTVDHLKREADRRYAAEVLRDEFRALGYEVGEEFVTAFQAGGGTTMHHRNRHPYAVEFTFEPKQDGFNSELVAADPQTGLSTAERGRRDRVAEENWCRDLAMAVAAAEEKQVRTRVRRRVAAGVRPVRVAVAMTQRRTAKRQIRDLDRPLRPKGS